MRAEYEHMLEVLGVRDLYQGPYPPQFANCRPRPLSDYPITLGDTTIDTNGAELPFETVLTQSGDYCTKQCVDYILFRESPAQFGCSK